MAEVKVSPKKVPIDDWVKAVKKIDASGLKDEEKKVFDMVKVHKNIPKSSSKFSNFCIHNLKVKNEKVINRIWGHLSLALSEQKGAQPAKETKDDKKSKLEKKLGAKKAKVNDTQDSDDDTGAVGKKAKLVKKAEAKKAKVENNSLKTGKAAPEGKKAKLEQKLNQKKNKVEDEPSDAGKGKKNKQEQKVELKKGKAKNGLPTTGKGTLKDTKNAPNKNGVAEKPKQEIKKKVSFGKTATSNESKNVKKDLATSKQHKPTPKKAAEPKGTKVDLKKGKKKVEEPEDSDDDDDDDDDDDELSFGSDDEDLSFGSDDDLSDEELDDSDSDEEVDDEDDSDEADDESIDVDGEDDDE